MVLMDFLVFLSLIFELLALILSFYFKNSKIFFLTLVLLSAKIPYFYASLFQANLFVSLFLPMIFTLFCLKAYPALILSNKNIVSLISIVFINILSLILPKNTAFNSANLDFHFISFHFFKPVNELGFLFFLIGTFLIVIKTLKSKETYLLLAFLGAYLQFFLQEGTKTKYFEFASLIFCFYFINHIYKIAFFDPLTKLPNKKSLIRFTKGKNNYTIALLHFNELKQTQESYVKLILKQIAKILKRFKAKIFIVENDFILIFNNKNQTLNHLGFLESTLKNTEFILENENFKPNFKLVWQENQGSLEQNLQSLKEKLLN
ncbi:hypothetical protein LNU06_01580 [Campylobacter sp. VicNov18]|uniref:hypothetical protein n=1 Tax=Campylobacter bilis TaxID=2691918 RepID=UPI00130E7779|nr:hypothetical protein [Campylobacter bilis]MPV63358.1 hypothetical protein [Campylobacter hepaticus]MBM0636857.1 hypothetical protein [Campylobacter bilis]MCC8277428.1 hypothetical protein [Campylobacter bilis]MCC8299171.1 hypothetical protein [Campylobacter bilis]MCC8300337.1 hypothetical protein [Campylobacter bilis]